MPRAAVFWLLGLSLCVACDDISPLPYTAPVIDASAPDHIDEDHVLACQKCATDEGSTCRPHYDACQSQDPRCGALLDCLTASDCWRQLDSKNLGNAPPCGTACLEQTHIAGINEIGAAAANFYICLLDEKRCAPACTDETSSKRDE